MWFDVLKGNGGEKVTKLLSGMRLNFRNLSRFREARLTWMILWSNPVAMAGMIIFGLFIFCVVFGPFIAPYGMNAINLHDKLIPPNLQHWFGTDILGRDIFSRVIFGTRISFLAGIVVVGVSVLLGGVIGLISGYVGRYVGDILMRITDIFLAFPTLILAMALASMLGPSLWNALLAMSLVYWPRYARLVYGQTLSIRENEYVKFAETLQESPLRIMGRHISPNVLGPLVVQTSLDFGDAILLVACLGFVGLGAQPPAPDWGIMVSDGRNYLMNAWWMATIPGLAIFMVVLACNLIGDGIRDALDPNLRRTKPYKGRKESGGELAA
jgi:peptide/nickel transport system permease protein